MNSISFPENFQNTEWTLDTSDGATIYGRKASLLDQKSSKAIYMVHGLAENYHELNFTLAAAFFASKGYDVYQFNLYDGRENGRRLKDISFTEHANDLKTVIAKFSSQYDKNFAIGHSFGGTTVALANSDKLTASSLWDPSYDHKNILLKKFSSEIHSETNQYVWHYGISLLISEEMQKQLASYDQEKCKEISKSYISPIQVILGGDAIYAKEPYSYDSFSQTKNRRDIIEGADHYFYNGCTREELFTVTLQWFEEF